MKYFKSYQRRLKINIFAVTSKEWKLMAMFNLKFNTALYEWQKTI